MNLSGMNRRTIALLLVLLLGPCIFPPLWCASPSHFGSYSPQIAKTIEDQKKSQLFPRILVIDFPTIPTGMDSVGPYLADDLSVSLESHLPTGRIVPRAKLKDFLDSHGLTQIDLQSISLAYWAAEKLEANEILYGRLSETEAEITLQLQLLRLFDTKEVAKWELKFDVAQDLNPLRGKALETGPDVFSANMPLRCSSEGSKTAVKEFKDSGGTFPKGMYMPNPPYSDKARKEKYSGSRQYDLFLNTKGEAVLVIPHYPVRPDLDVVLLETTKRWKFQPATLAGQPVAVCVPIEITWRLY
jgi:hypothetical protein